jgi:ABC-type transporter Mla MlaB component
MGHKTPSITPAPLIHSPRLSQLPRAESPFVEGLTRRLLRLCQATGLSPETSETAARVFREVVVPWSRVEAFAKQPPDGWASEISDDNTPIEFSVTLSPRRCEVRVLFEPQAEQHTLAAHRAAALAMHQELAQRYGADLSRFDRVKDLFTPPDMQGPFALWSAVVFANGAPPSFKAYFNPQAQGAGSAVALVEEGLRRLGLTEAWQHLARTLARRGPHRDELKYFALDLTASAQARVKVYVRHHDATPEDLEIAAAAAPGSSHGEAEDFARAMGGGARRFKERATFTCAAFVGGKGPGPSATTQYVPVCAYALDDLEVQERVASYLLAQRMDDTPYRRMLAAFANRPLDAGVGMQSWVAFRRYQGEPRLTVYLGSETSRVFAPGSVPAATRAHLSFENAAAVLSCVARYGLEEHPLLRGLWRFAEDRRLIFLLVSNTYELLAATAEWSGAQLKAWLEEHAADGHAPSAAEAAAIHLFEDALRAFRASPDPVEAVAAQATATCAARRLGKALLEFLETEETSSAGFSLEASLRDGRQADLAQISRLDAAGSVALPSVVRGAFGVHERLWVALDQLAELANRSEVRI